MNAVLGIDAGGSKTLAALVSASGEMLHLASGPGIDPTLANDLPGALRRHVENLVLPADYHVAAVTFGLPYVGEVSRISTVADEIARELFGPLGLARNDVEIAHAGAFAGGDGVLCLAGTGSMAWAHGPKGTVRTGGFGDLIGDEGSAFRIGQEALALLSHEIDGRRPGSGFGAALANMLGIESSLAGLMEWVYRHQNARAGIGSVARHVSALAAGGDADAKAILIRAGAQLAAITQAAARAAGLGPSAPLAFAGGVLADPIVGAEVARIVGTEPVPLKLPPVGGAALDAARRAGWDVAHKWQSALRSNLNARGVV